MPSAQLASATERPPVRAAGAAASPRSRSFIATAVCAAVGPAPTRDLPHNIHACLLHGASRIASRPYASDVSSSPLSHAHHPYRST